MGVEQFRGSLLLAAQGWIAQLIDERGEPGGIAPDLCRCGENAIGKGGAFRLQQRFAGYLEERRAAKLADKCGKLSIVELRRTKLFNEWFGELRLAEID